MSRSYKKNPHGGSCSSASEKKDKRRANRYMRRITNHYLSYVKDTEEVILPILREVSDPWDMAKDGKKRYSSETIELYPNLIRK